MRRILLRVAYDGTNYHGWQLQPNLLTIESVLNEKLSEMLKEEIKVIGASRTDTGVHSLGTIAVFDTQSQIPGDKFTYALNQRLPEDIRIQESFEVEQDFHPRHQDSKKTYEYKIWNAKFSQPVYRLYSYFVYQPLDVEKMQRAAQYLVGTHDFKSFCSVNTTAETTVRTLYSVDVTKAGELISIRVQGSGFLYNMVRIIAGTLIEVGRGSREPEDILTMLSALDRAKAGPTAPACGLTLVSYEYETKIEKIVDTGKGV